MGGRKHQRPKRRADSAANARRAALAAAPAGPEPPPRGAVLVDRAQLAPVNTYCEPAFVARGYYVDTPFRCVDCGKDEVWTVAQQKWWYEVAKGFIYSFAKRCRPCRQARRARRGGSPPT